MTTRSCADPRLQSAVVVPKAEYLTNNEQLDHLGVLSPSCYNDVFGTAVGSSGTSSPKDVHKVLDYMQGNPSKKGGKAKNLASPHKRARISLPEHQNSDKQGKLGCSATAGMHLMVPPAALQVSGPCGASDLGFMKERKLHLISAAASPEMAHGFNLDEVMRRGSMEGPDRLEREMHEKVDVDAFAASYCKKLCGQAIGRVLGRRSGAWPVPSNNVTPVCSMWDASSIHINDDLLSKYNNHSSGRSSFGEKSWKSAVALNLLVGAGGLHRVGSHSLASGAYL
jgi:hypothetical protein